VLRKGITLSRHILDEMRKVQGATGEFTMLFNQIAVAAKVVSREVRKAGLVEILGFTGEKNVHGEDVKKLDIYANETIIKALDHLGHICVMASEENEELIEIPPKYPCGKYSFVFDPLDGSSNIDVNVSIGTIFSIYRRISDPGKPVTKEDFLQPGNKQVAAGYIIYGSSTMLVYTTGLGATSFTLDPSIGEFCLTEEVVKTPEEGKIYSINQGNYFQFPEGVRKYIQYCQENDKATKRPYSLRYIGSLVADFHRNLLKGGIFIYPETLKAPNGKLRLLYECNPIAFIAEQAGGMAVDGNGTRILDIKPTELHQRVPFYVGSKKMVEKAIEFNKMYAEG